MICRAAVLAIAAVVAFPAFASADDMKMPMPHGSTASPADKANAAAMDRMMKGMKMKSTGNPDKDFVTMMLPHHQGAIDMAKVELQYGKDPALLDLAKGIVAAQEKEIVEMKSWLAAN